MAWEGRDPFGRVLFDSGGSPSLILASMHAHMLSHLLPDPLTPIGSPRSVIHPSHLSLPSFIRESKQGWGRTRVFSLLFINFLKLITGGAFAVVVAAI